MAACRSSSTSSPVALRARRSAQEPAPEPFSAARSPQPAPRRRAAAGPAADTHRDQNTLPNRTLSTTRRHRETIASGPISASEAKELSSHAEGAALHPVVRGQPAAADGPDESLARGAGAARRGAE